MQLTRKEKRIRATCALAVAMSWCVAAGYSQAEIMNYGDFDDIPPGTVMYLGVQESSGTDPLPLYGSPTVTGNLIDFEPATFTASAEDGNSDQTDGQLNFTLMSTPGNVITDFTLSESGRYTLFGTGTASTAVAAAVSVDIDIIEIDGVSVSPLDSGYSTSFTADLVSDAGLLQAWELEVFVDLNDFLVSNDIDFDFGVTKVEVVIDNQLIGISEDLSTAFIEKKDFSISTTTAVPEPGSIALLGLGSLYLLRRRR